MPQEATHYMMALPKFRSHHSMKIWVGAGLFSVLVGAAAAGPPVAPAPVRVRYNRDVRPILADNCFTCHGPDSAARKAGLRLDRREDAIKAEAFVPGKAEKSALVE